MLVPVGVLLAIAIAVLLVVVAYCYRLRRKSAEGGPYQPLSVHADDDKGTDSGPDI